MSKLIIDLLSDTHSQHRKFTCNGGNILIHSGDCSSRGKEEEIIDFLDWYSSQNYQHKIFVPGNHDWAFEKQPALMKEECSNRGIILLNDSGLIIKSMYDPNLNLKIYGSPVQPEFFNWAFNRKRGADIKKHWDAIPADTEILITHGPPMGILDEVNNYGVPMNTGCLDLYNHVKDSKIALHCFGHIHEGRGVTYQNNTTFVNASCLDRKYYPAGSQPIRIIREIHEDGSVSYLQQS